MKYIVGVKDVYEQCYEIEASYKEEAVSKLDDSFVKPDESIKVREDDFSFLYCLDDEYTIHELK